MKKAHTLVLFLFAFNTVNLAQDSTNFWQQIELPENIKLRSSIYPRYALTQENDLIIVGENTINDKLLALIQKNGTTTWDTFFYRSDIEPFYIYIKSNNIYLMCTDSTSFATIIIMSDDYGESWTNVFPGTLTPPEGYPFLGAGILFVDSKNDVFTSLKSGILYKTDYENNKWIKVLETHVGPCSCTFTSIIEDTIKNVLYASELDFLPGNLYGGVYRSIDGGNNWEHIGLINSYCSSLLQDKDNNILVSACGHHYYGTGGIYNLDQNTMQWNMLEYVPPFIIGNMVMNNKGDIIFGIDDQADYHGGIVMIPYQSDTIIDLTYNIGYNIPIDRIELDSDGYMYILTYYNKLYKSSKSSITNVNQTNKAKTIIYPNPFNDKISIKINEINLKDVEIQLINSLGQTVYNNKYGLFNNEININTSSLPVGLYHCKVSSGRKIISINKIIKIK